MADGTLPSAVIVPEQENLERSPEAGLKRRQSLTTGLDSDTKRRRLSSQTEAQDREPNAAQTQASPKRDEQDLERKRNRRDEERKRGQRLFGSLLGTLSQSSNSAAQRRRADIERKQQDKLKLQDEEYGELKKKKREERLAIRRKEQKLYEKELMDTRHSNLLATAHFLKTKTEPVLFYKPWQLRSEDEAIIRDQVREAEETIAREVEEYEARNAQAEAEPENGPSPLTETPAHPERAPASNEDAQGTSTEQTADSGTNDTNNAKESEETKPESPPTLNNEVLASSNQEEDHRGAEDDGGEVMEDNEDTVIY